MKANWKSLVSILLFLLIQEENLNSYQIYGKDLGKEISAVM